MTKEINWSQTEQIEAAVAVRDMIIGAAVTQMVSVAAGLGIADLLKDGPKSSEELCELTDTHPDGLYRLMRGLASVGVFEETSERIFELTPRASVLMKDSDYSMRAYAIWAGCRCWWQPWGNLLYSVKKGKTAIEQTLGMEIFEYFNKHKDMADIFNTFMKERIVPIGNAVCDAYDFSAVKKVVDIGGSAGGLMAAILKANPHLSGVVFDQPAVVEAGRSIIEAQELQGRMEFVGGDFFESVPAGGDIYILSAIIHDWDDQKAKVILRNCRDKIKASGRLLLVESVIKPDNEPAFGKLTDLNMLVLASGRERTENEFKELLAGAGFKLAGVIQTKCPLCILEASPV